MISCEVFASEYYVMSFMTVNMLICRLNITPPSSPVFGSPKSKRRSVKRVRTEEESVGTKYSHQGYIQIKEADADGRYIKLFNSGSQVSACKDCLSFLSL